MYMKLSLSIALYSLLLTPLSPLGVYESYNIVDFVNRNFQTDDQSKPNLVKIHYPLSYQSPNLLTKIEGVPNLDTQSQVSSNMPKYMIKVISISPYYPYPTPEDENESPIYIVKQVREMNNGRTGRILYRWRALTQLQAQS